MKLNFISLLIIATILVVSCKSSNKNSTISGKNHLSNENSEYLLQHASNPVDWYPWSEQALQKAKDENKLIIVSIGYSSCHWCHVMEQESFSDTAVSNFMNRHFINIKVDREERPDIDNIYMSDCQRGNPGACGWPLNAVTNSEGKTVWITTYLSKADWLKAIKSLQAAYEENPNEIEKMTRNFHNGEEMFSPLGNAAPEFTSSKITGYINTIIPSLDMINGGKKSDFKFPLPSLLESMLEIGIKQNQKNYIEYVETTLQKIYKGGIRDHIEGGYARYSTDPNWKVPHFEKMLYDNAQLVSVYAMAYQYNKNPIYLNAINETLNFIDKNMTSPDKGFYASIDADSEHEEGKYYAWTLDEIKKAINDPKELNIYTEYYGITQNGNWEHGKNVISQSGDISKILKTNNITATDLQSIITKSNQLLLTAKANRIKPRLDKKIICSWTAMMTKAYSDAYLSTQEPKFKETAISSGNFILSKLLADSNTLKRTFSNDKNNGAFLDDYAFTIQAFIKLYEISFDEKWLNNARSLSDNALKLFENSNSSLLYYNIKNELSHSARKIELEDNVIPSSNSVMCDNLYKLGLFLDKEEYKQKSINMLHQIETDRISRDPSFYPNWIRIMHSRSFPTYELAIVGPDCEKLKLELSQHFISNKILLGGINEGTLSLLKDKLQEGSTTIYVCKNKVCKLPVTSVDQAIKLLQ